MLRRKAKTARVLAEDPDGDFMVGRLVGAAEMAALHMRLAGGNMERYGVQLAQVTQWFLTDEDIVPETAWPVQPGDTRVDHSEGPTLVTTSPRPPGLRDPK